MKKRTIINILFALISLFLAFITTLPVLAEPETTDLPSMVITKFLKMPENTTTPSVTFRFDMKKVSNKGADDEAALAAMPDWTIQDVSYTEDDMGMLSNGFKMVGKTTPLSVEGLVWPTAGVYEYDLTEKNDTFSNTATETMLFSTAVYRVRVYVDTDPETKELYVDRVMVELIESDDEEEGSVGEKVDPSPTDPGGFSKLRFINTYLKKGGGMDPTDPGDQMFTLSKMVTGMYADLTKPFEFEVQVDGPGVVIEETAYKGYIIDDEGILQELDFLIGDQTDITLKHGQKLVFMNVHVGAAVTAKEKAAIDYTPSVLVTENGLADGLVTGTENTDLQARKVGIGDAGKNAVDFTNMYKQISPMGIKLDILPFLILFAVAGGGVGFYLFEKKRKRNG